MKKWRFLSQIWSGTLNWNSDGNKDGLVSILDTKKFEKFCMSGVRKNGHIFSILTVFKESCFRQCKSGAFYAIFGQEL